MNEDILRVVRFIQRIRFEDSLPIQRGFVSFPLNQGIYVFVHKSNEILYVGKTNTFRRRFKNHQALVMLYADGVPVEDIRINFLQLSQYSLADIEIIESAIVAELKPRYNIRIRKVDPTAMKSLSSPPSAKLADMVALLPPHIQQAIQDHMLVTGLTQEQVVELVFASFLDLDAVSFGKTNNYPTVGRLLEENAALKALLEARGGIPEDVPFRFLGLDSDENS